jgi:KaiC/GvpD/RAD55 family RecA-like ATPase
MIDDFLPEGALVGLSGQTGTGKTFLGTDAGLSVATGQREWLGRCISERARRVPVMYVPLEGHGGLKLRVNAWLVAHGVRPDDADNLLVPELPDGLDLSSPNGMESLYANVSEHGARLVVIDTLSDALGTVDEDKASSLRPVIKALRKVIDATGATILLVQHTGWDGKRERGSIAMRSAVDVMWHLDLGDNIITLKNNKQRDAEKFKPISLRLQNVPGTGSAVLTQWTAADTSADAASMKDRIVAALSGEPATSRRELSERVGSDTHSFRQTLSDLVGIRVVEEFFGPRRAVGYRLASAES